MVEISPGPAAGVGIVMHEEQSGKVGTPACHPGVGQYWSYGRAHVRAGCIDRGSTGKSFNR